MVDMDCAFGLIKISGVTDCIRYHQGNQHNKLHCTQAGSSARLCWLWQALVLHLVARMSALICLTLLIMLEETVLSDGS